MVCIGTTPTPWSETIMPNPIISVIERSRADGLHPGAIRIRELPDGTGELSITFCDMVGGNPHECLTSPPPAGVSCEITERVSDLVAPVPGTRKDWLTWIAETARIGGAPDYAIFEPCDPLAGIEADAPLWSICTKPVRWLTYELRRALKLGDYERDGCTCPECRDSRLVCPPAVAPHERQRV